MPSIKNLEMAAAVSTYKNITIKKSFFSTKAIYTPTMSPVKVTVLEYAPADYLPSAIGEQMASVVSETIEHHLGSTSTTLFFLMGAMTIVELVDQNGGFNFVRDIMQTHSKRTLLWRIAFMTFFLSAILDNLTTSIGTVTEVFYANLKSSEEKGAMQKRVTQMLTRIDMSTILFFLGILMAVACLETIGVLTMLGQGLNTAFNGNCYLITGIIGVLSSIVDNVPLVAGCMGMYPIAPSGDMAVDGIFWQLLAYCAGVGGSMLIIGSAAGVVVMGLEKITFGWYMKHVSWIAFAGYLAGIICYWVEKTYLF